MGNCSFFPCTGNLYLRRQCNSSPAEFALAVSTGSGTQAPALWLVEKKDGSLRRQAHFRYYKKNDGLWKIVYIYTCYYFKDFPRNSLKSRQTLKILRAQKVKNERKEKAPFSKKRVHSKSRKNCKLRAPKTQREQFCTAKT